MKKSERVKHGSVSAELRRVQKRLYKAKRDLSGQKNVRKELLEDITNLGKIKKKLTREYDIIRDLLAKEEADFLGQKARLAHEQLVVDKELKRIKQDGAIASKQEKKYTKLVLKYKVLVVEYDTSISKMNGIIGLVTAKKEVLGTENARLKVLAGKLDRQSKLIVKKEESIEDTRNDFKRKQDGMKDREEDYDEKCRELKNKHEAFRITKNKFYEKQKVDRDKRGRRV